ncbi:apextrin-like protein 1 [Elysia marginata]|uniref:Apextrin-like protein 1 n=1 Tax=Elysia marginata TaxID=1093978 RepID=A0AAV4JM73_9GAST|nr:apextrin-like protein 1 [Elysia marginata]
MFMHQLNLLASLLVLVLQKGLTLPVQDVSDPSMPLQLIVTLALVNRYTAKTMRLRCEHNPSVPSKLDEIFIIRIFKQSTSGWDLVAGQQKLLTSPKVTGSVTASANVGGDISEVFLQVLWDTLGPDCFGVFKCNVMGFDSNGDTVTERSSIIQVQEFKNVIHYLIGLTKDTQEKMTEMEDFTDTEIARLNSGLDSLESRITQQDRSTDSQISQMEKEIKDNKVSLAAAGAEISGIKDDLQDNEILVGGIESNQVSTEHRVAQLESLRANSIYWPVGFYALLKPKTGCPVDLAFHGGKRSYLKPHTQSQSSSDPADSHSSAFPRNTKSIVGSNKFVTLEFCEVFRQFNTKSWPKGSFCVNKLISKSCPSEFTDGYVDFDTEDSNDASEGKHDVANSNRDPYVYFCCQTSASASTPIQLPTHSPFFLYRKGGVCQAVQGMSVSEEYVQINTEDSSNDDSFSGSYPDVTRPGSSVIKLNMCYYTKL